MPRLAAGAGPRLTAGQIEALNRRIDEKAGMTLAEKYEAKTAVLKAGLEAGSAYTDAVEKLHRYTRIGVEPGTALRPEVGATLSKLSERVKQAADNPVFEQFGKIATGKEYLDRAVTLASDLNRIQSDTNLPPSAKRQLGVLRGAAEAVLLAGELGVPIPNGLDCYAEATKKLADAVLITAKNVSDLKDGGFGLTEQKEMLQGLPNVNFRRTPLFDKGIPIVQEVSREQGNDKVYLQVEPGRWTEVTAKFDYDQVANIVADYRCQYDGQNPSSQEIVKYLVDPAARQKLADDSYAHADYLIVKDLQKDIAPDMAYSEFLETRSQLKRITDGIGVAVPTDSALFRTMLQERLKNPYAYDEELRRIALKRWPDAREYLKYKGVLTIDTIPLDRLSDMLDEYRRGGDRSEFVAWVESGMPERTFPTNEGGDSTAGGPCPHCGQYHGTSQGDHATPTTSGNTPTRVQGVPPVRWQPPRVAPPRTPTSRTPPPPPKNTTRNTSTTKTTASPPKTPPKNPPKNDATTKKPNDVDKSSGNGGNRLSFPYGKKK